MQRRIRFAAVVLLCAAAPALAAQDPTQRTAAEPAGLVGAAPAAESAPAPASTAAPKALPSLAPTVGQSAVGARRAAVAPDPVTNPRRADTSRNRALMIVGGAALIVGAVIGGTAGTLIMVGGAVTGLFGLFQYLQ